MDNAHFYVKLHNNEIIIFHINERKIQQYSEDGVSYYDYYYDINEIRHYENICTDIGKVYKGVFLWKIDNDVKIYDNITRSFIDINKINDRVNICFTYNNKQWYSSDLQYVVKEILFEILVTQSNSS